MRTIYYAYKDEAGDTLRKVRVVDEPEAKARYYVRGTVTDYARGETWVPPSVETSLERYRTEHLPGVMTRAGSTRASASSIGRASLTASAITASGTACGRICSSSMA